MPTRAVENGVADPTFAMRKRVVFKGSGEKGSLSFKKIPPSVSCSDGSSSIGRNSDASENSMEKSGGGDEAQSSFKCPFDSAMVALEEVLPIRKGISRFYNGKSKSFASLAEASLSTVKELAKPDNAYVRRRRNRSSCLRSNGGSISKRVSRGISAAQCSSSGGLASFSLSDLSAANPDQLLTKPC